MKLAYSEEK